MNKLASIMSLFSLAFGLLATSSAFASTPVSMPAVLFNIQNESGMQAGHADTLIGNFNVADLSYNVDPAGHSVAFNPNPNGPTVTEVPARGYLGIDIDFPNYPSLCEVKLPASLYPDAAGHPKYLVADDQPTVTSNSDQYGCVAYLEGNVVNVRVIKQ